MSTDFSCLSDGVWGKGTQRGRAGRGEPRLSKRQQRELERTEAIRRQTDEAERTVHALQAELAVTLAEDDDTVWFQS